MPVLLFLPVWLIMYVGTLEEPTRSEGVLYEGGEVYAENCASCHGAAGGGGVGPAFNNGAVIETFSNFEDQVAWIVHGTQGYLDAGRETYGDTERALGGSGANMPNFGEPLEAAEILWATFYERIELSGHGEDLAFAEALFAAYDHGELELPEHFAEGIDGDFEAEIEELLAGIRAELTESEEVAAG
jgi:mono/diheme cytochrome c family protein|tara:strand:- start:169 stop:729 length:561 start_codon:yes stop_codon:yes gene_type:complete